MAIYSFSTIIGQTISFSATTDIINFGGFSATALNFQQSGSNLLISTTQGSFTLANFSIAKITPQNFVFGDGSIVAVGDLTANDTLDGGANNINFQTNTALASGFNASNLIFGNEAGDTIIAGNGSNIIYGGRSIADSADGGDSITVGLGSNTVYGNGGDDTLSFSTATNVGNQVVFYGGVGNDRVDSNGAQGVLFSDGGTGNDVFNILSSNVNNTVYGGAGNDALNFTGSTGDNLIFGGIAIADATDGNDTITIGGGNNTVYSNGGNDALVLNAFGGKLATIYAGAGNDSMTSAAGAGGAYLLYAGSGNDNINLTGHTGIEVIYGGTGISDSTDGADTIVSGSGSNIQIYGNGGNDAITVTAASGATAYVHGGLGNDVITATVSGLGAVSQLYGGTGNDTFKLNFPTVDASYSIYDFGTDSDILNVTMSGASAADLVLTRNASGTYIQRGNNTIAMDGFQGNFTASSFIIDTSSILATNFNNASASLTGGAGNDQLIAGDRGDTLTAGAGIDKLTGGAGNDSFSFTAANFTSADSINGGGGQNTLLLTAAGAAITDAHFINTGNVQVIKLSGASFTASPITLGSTAASSGITKVDASALAGSNGSSVDASGFSRGLQYDGGAGADAITGSASADIISTGAGNDTILAGGGADIIASGAGSDIFLFGAANSAIVAESQDVITDFDFGTVTTVVDTLRFSAGFANYNIGDANTTINGAIVNSVVAAGSTNTELVILKTVGVATSGISAALDVLNSGISPSGSVLNFLFDTTLSQAVLYYDANGGAAGGHILLASFTNINSLATLSGVDFADFSFI